MSITSSDKDITREQIFAASLDYFLDPIKTYLQDDTVTEIMVNGHDEIYVERHGQLEEKTSCGVGLADFSFAFFLVMSLRSGFSES